MHKIDSPGSSAGAWVDRDPVGGTPGTQFVATWMNEVQGELVNLIEATGIVLSKGTATQLRDAVKRVFGGYVTSVAAAQSPKTLSAGEAGLVLVDASAGAVVINLPSASALAGLRYCIVRVDSSTNAVTVNRDGTDTIFSGATSFTVTGLRDTRTVISDGVSVWYTPTPEALRADLGTDAHNGTDLPSAYPLGVSYFRINAATGWPFAGVVLTVRQAPGGLTWQIVVSTGSSNYNYSVRHSISDAAWAAAGFATVWNSANVGVANSVATLDGSATVPLAQIPTIPYTKLSGNDGSATQPSTASGGTFNFTMDRRSIIDQFYGSVEAGDTWLFADGSGSIAGLHGSSGAGWGTSIKGKLINKNAGTQTIGVSWRYLT